MSFLSKASKSLGGGFQQISKNLTDVSPIRTPTMEPDQIKNLENMQNLLSSQAQNAARGMASFAETGGSSAIDTPLINEFKESFVPSLMQGAASQGALGASGVTGAVSTGAARLSDMLNARREDRKYNASQSLMEMYKSFSQQKPYEYQTGSSLLSSLLPALSETASGYANADPDAPWYKKLGSQGWGTIGGLAGGAVGGPAGSAVGSAIGQFAPMLIELLSK